MLFNGELTILGVTKTNGTIKYLIKWTTKNMEYSTFIDSCILSTICPQMVIEFHERITVWNK